MGQKVNPISMRLQLNKDWSSKWFAQKKDYASYLVNDLKARRVIDTRLGSRAAIHKIRIERSHSMVNVSIHTAKAGVVIGRGGSGVSDLRKELKSIYKTDVRINVEEIKKPEMYAKLVAENIALRISKRINFRRAVKMAVANTMRVGAKGIRVEVSGRLNGAEMSRREKFTEGSVPLHTMRANIDYAFVPAQTQAGIIGVKVWINKGEAE